MRKLISALSLSAAALALAAPAVAQSQGDWTFGVGVAHVAPKSNNGTLAPGVARVGNETQLQFTGEYFIRDNIGIELLAATPFTHGINVDGVGYVGEAKQLPPTLSVNYHIPTNGKITPFVGVGINYTTFFEEKTALGTLELDDSLGLALNLGADWQISDRGAMRFNVRYIDIDSDVTLNGAPIGTAEIDPIVAGVSYVHRF